MINLIAVVLTYTLGDPDNVPNFLLFQLDIRVEEGEVEMLVEGALV